MIPIAQITHWRQHAPWASDDDVEQDLVISRSLVEVFRVPFLRDRLAFRRGTALHKLVLAPATRYSEDIDLVLLVDEPLGPVLDALREALTWIDPKPMRDRGFNLTMKFRFQTNAGTPRRLKVEANRGEHLSAPRVIEMPYAIDSPFFSGNADIRTYTVEELLATKLRALYQRKKGRDLYDLWYAGQKQKLHFDNIYQLFTEYWKLNGREPLQRDDVKANGRETGRGGVRRRPAPSSIRCRVQPGRGVCVVRTDHPSPLPGLTPDIAVTPIPHRTLALVSQAEARLLQDDPRARGASA